jgi:hypothetical protein
MVSAEGDALAPPPPAGIGAFVSHTLRRPSEEHEAIVSGRCGEKAAVYTQPSCAGIVSSEDGLSGVHWRKSVRMRQITFSFFLNP